MTKRPPRPGDWLADGGPGEGDRGGQDFDAFATSVGLHARTSRMARAYMPSSARKTIYLTAVPPFSEHSGAPALATVASFVKAWFGLPCQVYHGTSSPPKHGARRRGGREQLLTTQINSWLGDVKAALPDAFALLALTGADLYPEPRFNFVFGEAIPNAGVGVFSLARYHPRWPNLRQSGAAHALSAVEARTLLRRALKVVVHELGHIFQFNHCVYYECVMNGSNGLDETDLQPLHLCPVDLRKLCTAVNYAVGGLEPVRRYQQLHAWYIEHGLDREAAFAAARLRALGGCASDAADETAGPSVRCEPCEELDSSDSEQQPAPAEAAAEPEGAEPREHPEWRDRGERGDASMRASLWT